MVGLKKQIRAGMKFLLSKIRMRIIIQTMVDELLLISGNDIPFL
jgi:hypothetical protein